MKRVLAKSLSLLFLKLFLVSLSVGAQNCGDFYFENIRDTLVTNFMWPDSNPGFAFEMHYDTLKTVNTFYTSFFMTDISGDTVSNPDYYAWSYYFPVVSGQKDTYTMVLDSSLTTFPLPFEGFLLTENPECKIPVSFTSTSIEDTQKKNSDFNIYPNPSNHVIYIDGLSKGVDISIFNEKGELEIRTTYSSTGIKISNLIPGSYLVIGEEKTGFSIRKAFIKIK